MPLPNPGPTAVQPRPAQVSELPYPIAEDYVKDWTSERALVELIANALDEDPDTVVAWQDGVLTIHDQGPGIPRSGLLLGASRKTSQQIGQFGEGKKLAALVLARDPRIGPVQFDTVGYSFTPVLKPSTYLADVPGPADDGLNLVLHYQYWKTDRQRGTLISVPCPREVADEAIGRVLWNDDEVYHNAWGEAVEDELHLQERGVIRISSKLDRLADASLMALLGVRQVSSAVAHHERQYPTTQWVKLRDVAGERRRTLDLACGIFRSVYGIEALGRVGVYHEDEESTRYCTIGIYQPASDTVGVKERILDDFARTLSVLFHEGGHRKAARDGTTLIAWTQAQWRIIVSPHPTGYRRSHGFTCIPDYRKAVALAELLGIHAPVLYLGHIAVEGPLYNLRHGTDPAGRPWSKALNDHMPKVVADLRNLGGPYAAQTDAIEAMSKGRTPYDPDGNWLRPVTSLLEAEKERLSS